MTEVPFDSDRHVKPEDVEVERWGYFIGYGVPIEIKDDLVGFDYRYVSYSGVEAVKEMYPGFIAAVMGPIFMMVAKDFVQEMLDGVDKLEWKEGEPHLYTAECGNTPIFVSNHIPKELEADHPTNFTMIADHSQCTKDHCTNED